MHGVGGNMASKVVLKRSIRLGAWTSSAWRSHLGAATARQVITRIARSCHGQGLEDWVDS
jgi:hypothetical protein